jgi:hypothetical protein
MTHNTPLEITVETVLNTIKNNALVLDWSISSYACSQDTIYLDEPISEEEADWYLVANGNGSSPLLEFDYSTVKALIEANIIDSENTYIGYKPYVIYNFNKTTL